MGTTSELFARAARYRDGTSRAPLFEIEKLVRASHGDGALRAEIERHCIELIEGGPVLECVRFACRQLWIIGTAACVRAVAKLLADASTADIACYALAGNRSPEAGRALRDALGRGAAKGKARLSIVNTLGDRRDPESVPLLRSLATGGDAAIDEAAICALGKIGSKEAAAALREARASAAPGARVVAAHALLACAERLRAGGDVEGARALCRELIAPDLPAAIRDAAVRGSR